MANILNSYGDVSVKEDVLSDIEILTATEDMVHNTLGKTKAITTVHETLVDSLDTVSSLATAETADFSNTALTTPTRLTNLVQINVKKFEVSRTQRDIAHYHGEDELTRQVQKALTDWMNATELDLVRGSLVSGVSGTKPQMAGVINAISKSTNTTVQTSGTVFSASILRGLMKANWDNSNGDVATDIYVGSYLSNELDSFSNKTGVTSDGANITQIMNVVDVFETGLGRIRKHTHRYVQQAADATSRILGINPSKLRVAYLKKPYIDTGLQRNGDYDPRAVIGRKFANVKKPKFGENLSREDTELNLWLKIVEIVINNSVRATLKQSTVLKNVLGAFIQKVLKEIKTQTGKVEEAARFAVETLEKGEVFAQRSVI